MTLVFIVHSKTTMTVKHRILNTKYCQYIYIHLLVAETMILQSAQHQKSVYLAHLITVTYTNNNNNNNNHDNVYGAVIMAEPLREFTRFI